VIVASGIELRAGARLLLADASFQVAEGDRIGLVGRNGAGKTTLFRLIQGELTPGGGDITLPKAARIGVADQEQPATPVPLIETVLAGHVERAALMAELETAPPERQR